MKIKSILPYYGGKREQVATIVATLGTHQVFWEPFCGSMSVLFGKEPSRVEVVNDLHGGAVNLAQVVQNDVLACSLFGRLERTLFCQRLFDESKEWLQITETNKLFFPSEEWAYHYFVFSWQARNGLAGSENELKLGLAKRYTSNGGDPAVRFRNAVESIPDWWHRLRGVTILNECGVSLCERAEDKIGTAIYVDCPYLEKGTKYLHDFEEADHRRLAAALCRFKLTKVVVSYYQHKLLEELYPSESFRTVDCGTKKKVSASGRSPAPEVLLVNVACGHDN